MVLHSKIILTKIVQGIACLVESSRVELQADDGEYEDGEHDEEPDLHEGSQRLDD